mmetsp:Transcript_38557/g.115712  ORF Transcript_38557/g.115712 Transcript_38557/m.115712 type:complete len:362 (+) Transcript_38557:1814-2899(+)
MPEDGLSVRGGRSRSASASTTRSRRTSRSRRRRDSATAGVVPGADADADADASELLSSSSAAPGSEAGSIEAETMTAMPLPLCHPRLFPLDFTGGGGGGGDNGNRRDGGRSAFVPYRAPDHFRRRDFPPPSPIPSLSLTPVRKDGSSAVESGAGGGIVVHAGAAIAETASADGEAAAAPSPKKLDEDATLEDIVLMDVPSWEDLTAMGADAARDAASEAARMGADVAERAADCVIAAGGYRPIVPPDEKEEGVDDCSTVCEADVDGNGDSPDDLGADGAGTDEGDASLETSFPHTYSDDDGREEREDEEDEGPPSPSPWPLLPSHESMHGGSVFEAALNASLEAEEMEGDEGAGSGVSFWG